MRKCIIVILLASICIHSCKKSAAPTPPAKPTDTTATQKFTITASSGANGGITPNGKSVCTAGANVQYAITPIAGYNVATLSVDGLPVTPATSYTFTNVEADHTISVTFLQALTVTATAGPNGTVAPATQLVYSGNSAFVSFVPAATYRTDSLWVDGTFVKVLGGAISFTLSNVTANHIIKVSFSDALQKAQIDSLSNLLIGKWIMTSLNSSLVGLHGNYLDWDIQDIHVNCSSTVYSQYFANGAYVPNANLTGNSCNPLGGQQFQISLPNHWKWKNDGKVIYMTDSPMDSLTNVTVTKDSLIAIYFGTVNNVPRIAYKYHYARTP